jgi:predicted nucleic acid-binding protein
MYLLDTNVILAARKHDPAVTDWLRGVRGQPLFLSALTVGEIRRGIAKARAADPNAARPLERWLTRTVMDFGANILPVDHAVAGVWGDLAVGPSLPVVDALIAATALRHGLSVVTRNVRDFSATGVPVLNPWNVQSA